MSKAIPLMIQGTSSDAGKSVLVTAFCRIFAQDGYATTPFKSQNMALNSYITIDGLEIGRAQGVQAEACGIPATTNMNPILIKPTRDLESQIVVHGKPFQNMKAGVYRSDFFDQGLRIIRDAYDELALAYDRVVIEGAGSPAEINLNDREMVNMRVARMADAPVILVTDIERGGAFASLVGTLQLLEPEDRDRVIGVVINKFRGDVSLLQSGLDWFENYTGKPVLGVIPYIPNLYIDAEDSLILDQYRGQAPQKKELDIAVIRYPRISNFTDVDPFQVEQDCSVRYVSKLRDLGEPDLILLPGSKNTIEDLLFLRESGLEDRIKTLNQSGQSFLFGICGGYQMLGEWVEDPHQVESTYRKAQGMGLLPLQTTLNQEKTTTRSSGWVEWEGDRSEVSGYEIHMGQTSSTGKVDFLIDLGDRKDGIMDREKRLMGTYFHGIFHNDAFRWKLLNYIRMEKGLGAERVRCSFVQLREEAFDLIADTVRNHVKMDLIMEKMHAFSHKP